MEGRYNMRSPAVKRLMKEAQELRNATEEYFAQPLEDNLFEWHFTVRGPPDTDFDGGTYHGRIILPPEYPMKPPSIILLTPNGRFETNKKICLSISGHHPESWQPSWSIRTALLAIIGFMPTHGNGAIGSLDYRPEERMQLAQKSRHWQCPTCGPVEHLLPQLSPGGPISAAHLEARVLATQVSFQSITSITENTGSISARPQSYSDGMSPTTLDTRFQDLTPLAVSARRRTPAINPLLQPRPAQPLPTAMDQGRGSCNVAISLLICFITAVFASLLIRRFFYL